MKVDQKLAVEMLKTIAMRMKSRAENRERIRKAEDKRRMRAVKRGLMIPKTSHPAIGIVDDTDYGKKPKQTKLKDIL